MSTSVAVIGAGTAGRAHAPVTGRDHVVRRRAAEARLVAIADVDTALPPMLPSASATSGRSPAGRLSRRRRTSTPSGDRGEHEEDVGVGGDEAVEHPVHLRHGVVPRGRARRR
jgi:hypothetical protein